MASRMAGSDEEVVHHRGDLVTKVFQPGLGCIRRGRFQGRTHGESHLHGQWERPQANPQWHPVFFTGCEWNAPTLVIGTEEGAVHAEAGEGDDGDARPGGQPHEAQRSLPPQRVMVAGLLECLPRAAWITDDEVSLSQ